jgi:transcription elongation factor GreB
MTKPRSTEDGGKRLKNYITPAGYARLKAELIELIDRERPEVVKTVAWAASNGDRSENADYIYGKRRLREIDKRIRFLTQRLGCCRSRRFGRTRFRASLLRSDRDGH